MWGDTQAQTVEIECDGHGIAVTPNLHWALQHCRLQSASRVLWADAICINQSDPYERSEQVAFMGVIYARAHCVLVCFGEPPTPGNDCRVAALL